MIAFKAVLVLVLVLGVLFTWRAWKQLPALALFSGIAVLLVGAGLMAFKSPMLAVVGVLIALALMFYLSQPRRR